MEWEYRLEVYKDISGFVEALGTLPSLGKWRLHSWQYVPVTETIFGGTTPSGMITSVWEREVK